MMTIEQSETVYLKDYLPSDFLIDHVFLHVDIQDDHNVVVRAVLKVRRNPESTLKHSALVLDGEHLELKQVVMDGKILPFSAYTQDAKSLVIHVPLEDAFTVETLVRLSPADNTSLVGLYASQGNLCTQCESQSFRRITYFIDRPDVTARYTTTITADKDHYPILLSNGNLIEAKALSDNRHWVHWEDPSKKPSYLFALVAGDFDLLEETFVTCSGREIALRLYVEKGFKDQGDFALQALKHAIRWDEETFGREYDLDIYMIVAVNDFNFGAMENKGLNIFNTKYVLANSKTATDRDYVGIENVIGHEYFHNWSGNRVTCRDWFQITLKEGLTVFRDQSFIEDQVSPAVMRLESVRHIRTAQFAEDAGPIAHPIRPQSYMEVNNFYTDTVYFKGAEVIRMIQTLIGKALFRQGTDLYFTRYDGQAVTTEDFLQTMEDVSGRDFSQFKRWYDQAGTPVLEVSGKYDEFNHTFELIVKQSCPPTPGQTNKLPFYLPLSMGLMSVSSKTLLPLCLAGEESLDIDTRVLVINEPKQVFQFRNVHEKPIPSLLRNFSAPVRLLYPYNEDELFYLFEHDTDAFSRWEAGQTLMRRFIFCHVDGEDALFDHARLIQVFHHILSDPSIDDGYRALLLSLPSDADLIMQSDQPRDIADLCSASTYIKVYIATELESVWHKQYIVSQQTVLDGYTPKAMMKHALEQVCLSHLVATGEAKYRRLAYRQFERSDGMTHTMSALLALMDHECVEKQKALDEFYQQWQQYPLLVNKWFSLQAQAKLPVTLTVVKHLLQHAAFDIKTPNKVYALLNTFGSNISCFHQADGEGYRLIADQVLVIDSYNSQVAARLLRSLLHFNGIDHKRIGLMKGQVTRIAKHIKLSQEVSELVSKGLS